MAGSYILVAPTFLSQAAAFKLSRIQVLERNHDGALAADPRCIQVVDVEDSFYILVVLCFLCVLPIGSLFNSLILIFLTSEVHIGCQCDSS